MKVLHYHIAILQSLFVGKVIHKIEQTILIISINDCILAFNNLLIQLNMLRTFIKHVIQKIDVELMNSFGTKHVNDGN